MTVQTFEIEDDLDRDEHTERQGLIGKLFQKPEFSKKCVLERCIEESVLCAQFLTIFLFGFILFICIFALLPHFQPFNPTTTLLLTLAAWYVGTKSVLCPVYFSSLCMCCLWNKGKVTFCGAMSYFTLFLILLRITANDVMYFGDSSILHSCLDKCSTPFKNCREGDIDFDVNRPNATTPGLQDDAIAWFAQHVYGDVAAINSTAFLYSANTIRVIVGDSHYDYKIQEPGRDVIMFALRKNDKVTSGIVEPALRMGWSAAELDLTNEDYPGSGRIPFEGIGLITEDSAHLIAIAKAVRSYYRKVIIYGCSVGGKIVYWAAANSPKGLFDEVLIDSCGSLISSFRIVGPCGEQLEHFAESHPQWLNLTDTGGRIENWEYGIGDINVNCNAGVYRFGCSRFEHSQNFLGAQKTVTRLEEAGCKVEMRETFFSTLRSVFQREVFLYTTL